jgi:hypothetical protein
MKKLFLIIFGLALAFVIGEISFRLLGYSRGIYYADKSTGLVVLQPNQNLIWAKDCYRNTVVSNSLGFHDVQFNKNKPADIFRIAVVGDSQVESLQVPLEKTWYKILESKLNNEFSKQEKKFEIYSFGHSGNGQMLDYLYLKNYALDYKLDLVIDLFLVENDFRDDSLALNQKYVQQTGDAGAYAKLIPIVDKEGTIDIPASEAELAKIKKQQRPTTFLKELLKKSSLIYTLYQKFQAIQLSLREKSQIGTGQDVPVDFEVFLNVYPPGWEKIWGNEERLILTINKTANDNGAKFLLVTTGGATRVERDKLKANYISQLDFDKPEKIFNDFTARNNIFYLALTDPLRKKYLETNQDIMFPCDGHWNELGHQWTADAIFDYLRSHPELTNKQ